MKNKKALLALALVLILGTTLVAGGTLAWFSDTDQVTNTFTVGSVEIVQNETDDKGKTFVQDQQLIPVVPNGDLLTDSDPTDDANFIHKQVTVTNTGKNAAYVQTYIAVPKALHMDGNGPLKLALNLADDGWVAVDGKKDTMTYDAGNGTALELEVYCYRYTKALDGSTTVLPEGQAERHSNTPILLRGVYIDKAADMDVVARDSNGNATEAYFLWNGVRVNGYDLAKIDTLPVLVATQAVQAQGFKEDVVNNKSAAQVALDNAFPNHPWYVTNP